MITSLNEIKTGSVLMDASVLMASILTEQNASHVIASTELHFLLDRCHSSQVHAWVTPEAATRLWKALGMIGEQTALGKLAVGSSLKQKPKVLPHIQAAQRMKAFALSPFHLLRISSATLERSVDLWEKTGAGIEACVALSAFQEIGGPPYVVVTANNHYDELASESVFIVRPTVQEKAGIGSGTRPQWSVDGGGLMFS